MPKLKAALIGASGYATVTDTHRLDSFGWHQLDKLSNLRDCDAIVISLLEERPADDDSDLWNVFVKHLNTDTCRAITMHGGRIIVVGDPRFKTTTTEQGHPTGRVSKNWFLDFTGGRFDWDTHAGESLSIRPDLPRGVETYQKHLRRWNYSLREAVF